jgi:hypothetical protein
MQLTSWFHVTFDETKIYLDVRPPGQEFWKAEIGWAEIIRICYQAHDYTMSDELYLFTNKRKESYLIPVEADGGLDLWNELVKRNLFDPELAIRIAMTHEGIFNWPPVKDDEE